MDYSCCICGTDSWYICKCDLAFCKECLLWNSDDIDSACCKRSPFNEILFYSFIERNLSLHYKDIMHFIKKKNEYMDQYIHYFSLVGFDNTCDYFEIFKKDDKEYVGCKECEFDVSKEMCPTTCKCSNIRKFFVRDVQSHRKYMEFCKDINALYDIILRVSPYVSECRICRKETSAKDNTILCCNNYQCVKCGFIVDERANIKEFEEHRCGAFKYCPCCKVPIIKSEGCDKIVCICGYEFMYQTLCKHQFDLDYVDKDKLSFSHVLEYRTIINNLDDVRDRVSYILLKFLI